MTIISVENLSKTYGIKTLFENINFHINEGDKIGIVGINGTGKSTLLKIIAGIKKGDSGDIIKAKKTRIEYLSQSPEFDKNATVLEQVLEGDSKVFKLLRAYERIVQLVELNPNNIDYQQQLLKLSEEMTAADAWELESQVKTVLTKLNINNFELKVSTLSGGQKKRVALATALISPCDVLILDEPTNHMDNETIDWLEQYLAKQKIALLMVTHDRYFLDRVCNRILEISNGQLFSYEGNYTAYVSSKVERMQLASRLEKKHKNLYKQELAWIQTGARARSTKQKARIQRFEELKKQDFITEEQSVEISVGYTRMGKKTMILNHISKGYNGQFLFEDFSYTFLKEDRIGIIGPNGAGKTTLLNTITGQLQLNNGHIEYGETVKVGYFSQEANDMDESLRVIDYIKETAEYISNENGYQLSASQMLENFLFVGEIQYAPIHSLSGGEKRRLYLLKILMETPNVLILDEPTNDLDIDTLKVLEDYIDYFKGIVITVSHDRYFLDRICNKIFSFEPNEIIIHTGNYDDYTAYKKDFVALGNTNPQVKKEKPKNDNRNSGPEKVKLSYKEQQKLLHIEDDIEALEKRLETLNHELSLNQTNYVKLQELSETIECVELELLEELEVYEELQNKVALIEQQKNNK